MQANCTSRKFFILVRDLMKNHYPKEEDIQGTYISALEMVRTSLKKQIEAMIRDKDGFVCQQCKVGLEFLLIEAVGGIENFTGRRRLGESTYITLAMFTQNFVVNIKDREAKMQTSCLCKGQ